MHLACCNILFLHMYTHKLVYSVEITYRSIILQQLNASTCANKVKMTYWRTEIYATCSCQIDWSEDFRKCISTGVFIHKHVWGLQRKRENIQWAAFLRPKNKKIKCHVDAKDQKVMDGLVQDDRKPTVTQITAWYYQFTNIIEDWKLIWRVHLLQHLGRRIKI